MPCLVRSSAMDCACLDHQKILIIRTRQMIEASVRTDSRRVWSVGWVGTRSTGLTTMIEDQRWG